MIHLKVLKLLLGIMFFLLFMILLHLSSYSLPGSIGTMIHQNRVKDIEVYSYVYSDLGDMNAFLDDVHGKYGRNSLEELCSHN